MDGGAPYDLDMDPSEEQMFDALVMAGTDRKAAQLYACAIVRE